MKHFIEILKQIFYLFYHLLFDIIKTSISPITTLIIKISILSLILYLICIFVPHGLPFLSTITYIGWVTIICVYNLITFKMDDNFDSEYNEILNKNSEEIPEIQTEEDIHNYKFLEIKPMKDLISNQPQEKIKNDNESTRE
jgi:hypothetical protein